MPKRHMFRIEANACGAGTRLYMDGKPLVGVEEYSLDAAAHRATRLTLVMLPEYVEVDGEAGNVVLKVAPCQPPTS